MDCPNCTVEMTSMALHGHQGTSVAIDLCAVCQAFWFDRHESLKLAPVSTLELMKFIGENAAPANGTFSRALRCPRCSNTLKPTNDLQRSTRFSYWRCDSQHGRFIRFFDFLREKDFIRPLTPLQIAELRQHVHSVNCSNCGAPVDLGSGTACLHCKTPLSMLDMKQSAAILKQLGDAAVPRPVDPAMPIALARARRDVETLFGGLETDTRWWSDVSSSGLVEAGLGIFARWIARSI
jgi:Zn-finger nucleic acid-binding protein